MFLFLLGCAKVNTEEPQTEESKKTEEPQKGFKANPKKKEVSPPVFENPKLQLNDLLYTSGTNVLLFGKDSDIENLEKEFQHKIKSNSSFRG